MKKLSLSSLTWLFLLALCGCAAPKPQMQPVPLPPPDPVTLQIREHLGANDLEQLSLQVDSDPLLRFYSSRDFRPAWVQDGELNSQGLALLSVLRRAEDEGLDPRAYHLEQIDALLRIAAQASSFSQLLSPGWISHLDLHLSNAFLRYARHMTTGRLGALQTTKALSSRLYRLDPLELLRAALEKSRVEAALLELAPPHEEYRKLRKALGELRLIEARGGWPFISGEANLMRLWSRDPRVPALKQRLRLSGNLRVATGTEEDLLDRPTGEALKEFQSLHGLSPDAVIGEKTLEALNLSPKERILPIELSMERWRALPRELGERHLRVNIPDYRLEVFEQGELSLEMPVVVGRSDRPTPSFSALMTFVEFSPYWYVPPTILAEDELPRIKEDRRYLDWRNFEIVSWDKGKTIAPEKISWDSVTPATFPGMLRQKPGPRNPLGRVKFIFPNPHAVYIHDTPKRRLFDQQERSLSSGCIRIARPEELATHLLMLEEGWDANSIEGAMNKTTPLRVDLADPVPVHLTYFTAWVDAQGRIQMRSDLYDLDRTMDAALEKEILRLSNLPLPMLTGPNLPVKSVRLNQTGRVR